MNKDVQDSEKLVELLTNRFLSITIDDFLNQRQVVEKLDDDMDRAYKVIGKLESKYENTDEEIFDKLSDINNTLLSMSNQLYSFKRAVK